MENNKNNISRDQQQPPLDSLSLSLSLTQQPPPRPLSLPPPSLQTVQEVDRHIPHHLLDQMVNVADIKNHPFPISRVKRIMKLDPDVAMVSSEAPIVLSKACEMLVADLTHLAWLSASEKKRDMIEKPDVINVLASHEPYDFLLDLFPNEEPIHPEPVAPSGSLDPTNVIDLTNMIQPPPNCVMGVPVYYPLPLGLVVMGTPVVFPAWPRVLPPAMAGGDGADEAGPSGTANDGGN